jgi:putative SOS response-associated peptidase YedK
MCGRYSFEITPSQLQGRFAIAGDIPGLPARYNVAPTQIMPVVVRRSPNRVALMRWGLIPSWAKDEKAGNRMINARAERVATSPAFRKALAARRCIVPASGFYGWRREGRTGKVPYWIFVQDEPVIGFAGLYAHWSLSVPAPC